MTSSRETASYRDSGLIAESEMFGGWISKFCNHVYVEVTCFFIVCYLLIEYIAKCISKSIVKCVWAVSVVNNNAVSKMIAMCASVLELYYPGPIVSSLLVN
jgi:hypothetical protein